MVGEERAGGRGSVVAGCWLPRTRFGFAEKRDPTRDDPGRSYWLHSAWESQGLGAPTKRRARIWFLFYHTTYHHTQIISKMLALRRATTAVSARRVATRAYSTGRTEGSVAESRGFK
jgi:hypothetical protein